MSVKVGENGELTIDELAQKVGMTVRNLREWRALGLLPPPVMRGRSGYYDASHLARIERIKQLHSEGFPLDLIRRMLDASDDAMEELMNFAHALREPLREQEPQLADLADMTERWGVTDPAIFERAVELGLLRRREDGQFEFPSARVARVGEALLRLGLSPEETMEVTALVRSHADGIVDTFRRVFNEHVWEPFLEAGQPKERWPEVRKAVEELQPIALDALIGMFNVALEAKVEEGIFTELERLDREQQAERESD